MRPILTPSLIHCQPLVILSSECDNIVNIVCTDTFIPTVLPKFQWILRYFLQFDVFCP